MKIQVSLKGSLRRSRGKAPASDSRMRVWFPPLSHRHALGQVVGNCLGSASSSGTQGLTKAYLEELGDSMGTRWDHVRKAQVLASQWALDK